jgi:hypothetical protein
VHTKLLYHAQDAEHFLDRLDASVGLGADIVRSGRCACSAILTAAIFFFCTPEIILEVIAGMGISATMTANPTMALQPRMVYRNPKKRYGQ